EMNPCARAGDAPTTISKAPSAYTRRLLISASQGHENAYGLDVESPQNSACYVASAPVGTPDVGRDRTSGRIVPSRYYRIGRAIMQFRARPADGSPFVFAFVTHKGALGKGGSHFLTPSSLFRDSRTRRRCRDRQWR